VIDVGMRQDDEIDRSGIEVEGATILVTRFAPALEHAAIDQKAHAVGFQQVAGARHFARCAKKSQFHIARPSPASS